MSIPNQRATSAVEDFPALIAGSRRMAASGETLEAVDPATGQLIGRFPRCGAPEIDAAVEAAGTAAREWGRVEIRERARLLEAIAGVLEAHADELALLDSHDNGSTLRMLRDDVAHAIEQLRYFAGIGPVLLG
jgi:acyl-CoA reductase-like NAD-dependent aldehyde dehydrogenase